MIESPQPGAITGHFDQVWSGGGFNGTARIISELRSMSRTSAASLAVTEGPAAGHLTLDDLIRLVRVRR